MKLLLLSEYERKIIVDALELFIQKVEDPNTTVLDKKTGRLMPAAKTIIQEDAGILLKRVAKKRKKEVKND